VSPLISLLASTPNGLRGTLWMPPRASTAAGDTDGLFYFIYYLCAFFFILIVGVTLLFIFKYRRKRSNQRTSPIEGNQRLEIIWAVIPAILLVVIFLWGFRGYLGLAVPPAEAIDVRVTAQKWSWTFDYPKLGVSGATELIVPEGRAVKLTMSSRDVIHSFYVPAFRVKKDVIPNRYSVLWFEATERGTYDVMCAEYCGTGHSKMITHVKVVNPGEFEDWAKSGGGGPPDGAKLFAAKGCVACHSLTKDRRGLPGPPLAGKYGSTETFADGSQLKIDDNYIRESVTQPMAKVVKGFTPVMPTFKGQLNDAQIGALIDFIKTLK